MTSSRASPPVTQWKFPYQTCASSLRRDGDNKSQGRLGQRSTNWRPWALHEYVHVMVGNKWDLESGGKGQCLTMLSALATLLHATPPGREEEEREGGVAVFKGLARPIDSFPRGS